MKRALAISVLALASCSSSMSWRPHGLAEPKPLVSRGWAYSESEKEALRLDAGATPSSYSAPLVVGEKVVFGSERFGITVLAKKSGQVLWQKRFPEPVAAQPLVNGNSVFVGTAEGNLYSFDLDSGHQNWVAPMGAPVQGSFLLAFDRLYVSSLDEALHAVDPASGKALWTYRRPAFSGTSIRGGGNPAAINQRIWLGFSDGSLVSLDPQTGGLDSERSFHDNLKFLDLDARVLGWKDGLLVSTYDGKLRHLRKDGSLAWEFPAGGERNPVLVDEVVYLPSSDGTVYAINADTGKELWRYALARGVPTSVTVSEAGGKKVLLVTGSEEKVFVLSAANGEKITDISLGKGSGSYAPIALDAETKSFYVLSSFSRVYQFYLN
jgi:outer membrane protein assembly factor BamB